MKIQITQCDEFTRKCLERQVALQGYESVEEFIARAALNILENFEEDTVLNPRTGEAVVSSSLPGSFIGCKVGLGQANVCAQVRDMERLMLGCE